MTKIYYSHSQVSLNVRMSGGTYAHISFEPMSNGHSRYSTVDKEVQDALERHYDFNNLFRLVEAQNEQKTPAAFCKGQAESDDIPIESDVATSSETGTTVCDGGDTSEENSRESKFLQIPMSDYNAAKEYLAEKYGYSRTTIRSQKAIVAAAANEGIQFVFPE